MQALYYLSCKQDIPAALASHVVIPLEEAVIKQFLHMGRNQKVALCLFCFGWIRENTKDQQSLFNICIDLQKHKWKANKSKQKNCLVFYPLHVQGIECPSFYLSPHSFQHYCKQALLKDRAPHAFCVGYIVLSTVLEHEEQTTHTAGIVKNICHNTLGWRRCLKAAQ